MRKGRKWTEADDAMLKALFDQRVPYAEQAIRMGRTPNSVAWRRSSLGLCLPSEECAARRANGVRNMPADRAARRRQRMRDAWSDERREKTSEWCREHRPLERWSGTHTPESRAKMVIVKQARADRELDFAPRGHPLRDMYDKLRRKVGAQDARRIIKDHIATLPQLDRQILAIARGAVLINTRW